MSKIKIDDIRKELRFGKRLSDIQLRVTYYARVSTDREEQLGSLENQKNYFENKIKDNFAWIFVPGYIDEGVTGTSAEKRIEFLSMIHDAKLGKFDLILTKEVSRFARDLLDTIQYTRELVKYEVGILFEDINLNTIEADAELRLAIMASVAQEESRKLSDRVRFGWRRGQEAGKRHGATPPIGYIFNNDNNGYCIDPHMAEAVKYVFRRYCEDKVGVRVISRELMDMGYTNAKGNPFHPSTIKRMITHPVYKGYIVGRKTENTSYRDATKKTLPYDAWILHYDPIRVPPIIEHEEWALANNILSKRGEALRGIDCLAKTKDGGGKYAYSSRVFCCAHNCNYQRTTQRWEVDGVKRTKDYWRCASYKKVGTGAGKGCTSPLLYTSDLNRMMRDLFDDLLSGHHDVIVYTVKKALEAEGDTTQKKQIEDQIDAIRSRKAKILTGWLNGVVKDDDYKSVDRELSEKIDALEERLKALELRANNAKTLSTQAKTIQRVLHNANTNNESVLEELVRCFVKKIIVKKVDDSETDYIIDIMLYIQDVAPYRFAVSYRTPPNLDRRTAP